MFLFDKSPKNQLNQPIILNLGSGYSICVGGGNTPMAKISRSTSARVLRFSKTFSLIRITSFFSGISVLMFRDTFRLETNYVSFKFSYFCGIPKGLIFFIQFTLLFLFWFVNCILFIFFILLILTRCYASSVLLGMTFRQLN